ncbi:MAG: DUF3016 domain-containing protein [Rhodanobacteraceae bacterium]|nr:DUF3016 domain-containing protein [Rhodanobacteraceae bacterium]
MRTLVLIGCALAAALLSTPVPAADHGPVTVVFVQPEKFTDVRDRQFASPPDKNPNLSGLRRYLETRGKRYLTGGQQLKIEFTDIDLAGDHRAQSNVELADVRLVTSLYPPRLEFNYRLTDATGTALKSGTVKLRDLGFDTTSTGTASGPLRYEQRMLDKWLRQEIRGE